MTAIILPPLPDEFLMHPTQGECYTADQLRARDLEVARVVLEGAARWYNDIGREECRSDVAHYLRNLEVGHHDPEIQRNN